jgi:hypothetical protein
MLKITRTGLYTKLVEIAASYPGRSWKFVDMIDKLKRVNTKVKIDEDRYIGYWFFSHFHTIPSVKFTPNNFLDLRFIDIIKRKPDETNTEVYLNKDSYYSFIETQELHEAREASLIAQKDSKTAQKQPNIATWIAAIAFIASTVLQIVGLIAC